MGSIGLALPSGVLQDELSVHSLHRDSPGDGDGSPIDDLVSKIESLPRLADWL